MNISELKNEFTKRFGNQGDLRVFMSPGRVNLIGEHTDYNGGYVLPAAILLGTTIIARLRNDNKIQMCATDLYEAVTADIDNLQDFKNIPWGNYQLGVVSELKEAGYQIHGCDLLYHDTVPHGGGLSSSAAIEVATALCFATFSNNGKPVDMIEMAKIGQRAENNFIGVSCGIMDQFASAMGKENHAIFLNCRDLSFDHVPLNLDGKSIVITNTNKKRSLITSKYNERRLECEKGLEIIKQVLSHINYLGEVSPEEFEKCESMIKDETIRKRVMHVVFECDRVKKSVKALNSGDIKGFGQLMNESHDSLKDLYEVTGIELDTLVYSARKQTGCIGSRMTGAGFGGCSVSIVDNNFLESFIKEVENEYISTIGYSPSFYITSAGDGGKEL